jgi:predicted ATPase
MVAVPPKALAVLWQLASQAGQVLSKAMLLDTVWAETAVSEGTLTNCLSLLRQVLGEDARQPRFIATVHRLGYRFVAPVTPADAPPALAPLPVASAPSPPPPLLVGRAAECAQLHARFAQAQQGQRQLVFVTGEAGMGKTTLVDAFVAEVTAAQTAWIGRGQCIDHYGAGEAYMPLLDALGRLGRGPQGAQLVACLHQYASSWLGPLATVVGEGVRGTGGVPGPGATPQRMLRELAEALDAFTAEHPLILVLEDLHWSDASTVEALGWLARRRDTARLLVIGTYRPVELILRQHPLKVGKQELQLQGHCAEVPLGYLPVAAVQAYLAQRGPAEAATAAWAAWVHRRTEGQPLFMVHVVEEVTRRGRWPAAPAPEAAESVGAGAVPAGLQQLIELQLGQLDAAAQQVLEVASVVGAEFTEASVAAGLAESLEAVAVRCDGLAQQGQFIEDRGLTAWPDGTVSGRYGFRHALYQEMLYRRIGSGRRVRCHRAIGMRLEAAYGAQTHEVAAELALHFERGYDAERAVQYRQQAAEQALRRCAYPEAQAHLMSALALLATLPETPTRQQAELRLQLTLGVVLLATRGYAAPEVEQAYARALALCQEGGELAQQFAALRGLWNCYLVQTKLQQARASGEHLLTLAQRQDDPALLALAHRALGTTWFWLGDFPRARVHLEHGIALATPLPPQALLVRYGEDPGLVCRLHLSLTLWALGYPDQAAQQMHEALAWTQALAHPFSQAFALVYAAWLHQYRREPQPAQARAEQAMAVATEYGLAQWLAMGTLRRGWALVVQGQGAAALGQFEQGLATLRATGTGGTGAAAIAAETYSSVGQIEAGLAALGEAFAGVSRTGERHREADMYRVKGDLLLQALPPGLAAPWSDPRAIEAEGCLQQALDCARQQQAKSLELRAAMRLARLWQQQGKQAAARDLLAPLYGWFTEGFDTPDLQEARALLEELA